MFDTIKCLKNVVVFYLLPTKGSTTGFTVWIGNILKNNLVMKSYTERSKEKIIYSWGFI